MRRYRFSIAGLMAVVLIAAVGLAALRDPSSAWAGAIFVATWTCLGTAIVGAVVRRGAARAQWLGFAVFGCGYMILVGLAPPGSWGNSSLPTSRLLVWLRPLLGHPEWGQAKMMTVPDSLALRVYLQIGHSLLAMAAGLVGGIVARSFRGTPGEGPEPQPQAPEAPATVERPRRRWVRPALVVWSGLLLVGLALAIRSGPDAPSWAGLAFLLTCGLLGLAGLAAIFGRGRRRQAAVGAVLFGVGYLFLAFGRAPYQLWQPGRILAMRSLYQPLPTSSMLNGLRRWTVAIADGHTAANVRIVAALEHPVTMTFPEPTPLQDVLRYVTMATAAPDFPGIPIYLDPLGLRKVDQTPTSAVTIDLVGVPLKTSLRLCLEPLGLDYCVRDGYLRVSNREDAGADDYGAAIVYYTPRPNDHNAEEPGSIEPETDLDDPFLVAGHCLLVLLAAGFGAVAAPIVAGPRAVSITTPERT